MRLRRSWHGCKRTRAWRMLFRNTIGIRYIIFHTGPFSKDFISHRTWMEFLKPAVGAVVATAQGRGLVGESLQRSSFAPSCESGAWHFLLWHFLLRLRDRSSQSCGRIIYAGLYIEYVQWWASLRQTTRSMNRRASGRVCRRILSSFIRDRSWEKFAHCCLRRISLAQICMWII